MAGACVSHTSSESDEWNDEPWTVDCPCGVTYDDGEEMVQCDLCSVWVHTGCCNVPKHPKHLATYVCDKCRGAKPRRGKGDSDMEGLGRDGGEEPFHGGDGDGEDVCGRTGAGGLEDGVVTVTDRDNSVGKGGVRSGEEGGYSGDDDDVSAEFSIEDRVHKHGCPEGDLRALTSGSAVFSRPLWRAVGLVPKVLNFQCNDLPPPVSEDVDLQQMLLRPEPIEKIIERERVRLKMRLQLGKQKQSLANGAADGPEGDGFLLSKVRPSVSTEQPKTVEAQDNVHVVVAPPPTVVRGDSQQQASCLVRRDDAGGPRCSSVERLEERGIFLSRDSCENGAVCMSIDSNAKVDIRGVSSVVFPESCDGATHNSAPSSAVGASNGGEVYGGGQGMMTMREAVLSLGSAQLIAAGIQNGESRSRECKDKTVDSDNPVTKRVVGDGMVSTLASEPSCYYVHGGMDARGFEDDEALCEPQKRAASGPGVQREQVGVTVEECAPSLSCPEASGYALECRESGSLSGRICFNCCRENTAALTTASASNLADCGRAAAKAAGKQLFDSRNDGGTLCALWLCSGCGDLFSKKQGVCTSGVCRFQSIGYGGEDSLKATREKARVSCSVCQRWCHTRCLEQKKEKAERASSSSGSSHEYFCVDCEKMTLRLRSLRQSVVVDTNESLKERSMQGMDEVEELRSVVRMAVVRSKGAPPSYEITMGGEGRLSGRTMQPQKREMSPDDSDDNSSVAVDSGPQKRRRKNNRDRMGHPRQRSVDVQYGVEEVVHSLEEDGSAVGRVASVSENEAHSTRENGGSVTQVRLDGHLQMEEECGASRNQEVQPEMVSSMDSLVDQREWERSGLDYAEGKNKPHQVIRASAVNEILHDVRYASPSSPVSVSVSSRIFANAVSELGQDHHHAADDDVDEAQVFGGNQQWRSEGEVEADMGPVNDVDRVTDLNGQQLPDVQVGYSRAKAMLQSLSYDGGSHSTECVNGSSYNVDAVPSSPLDSLATAAANGSLDGGLQESRSSSPHAAYAASVVGTGLGGHVCNERLSRIEERQEEMMWGHDSLIGGDLRMEVSGPFEEAAFGGREMSQHAGIAKNTASVVSLHDHSSAESGEKDAHQCEGQPLRPRHGNLLPQPEEEAQKQHRQRQIGQLPFHHGGIAEQVDSRPLADQNLPHHVMRPRTDVCSGLRSRLVSSCMPQRAQSRPGFSARSMGGPVKNGSPAPGSVQLCPAPGSVSKTGTSVAMSDSFFPMPAHMSLAKQAARKPSQLPSLLLQKSVVSNGPLQGKSGSGSNMGQNGGGGKTVSSVGNGIISRQSSPHPSPKPPLSCSRSKIMVSITKFGVQQSAKSYKSDSPDSGRAAGNIARTPSLGISCSPSNNYQGSGNLSSGGGEPQLDSGSRLVLAQSSSSKVTSAKISLQSNSVNGVGLKHGMSSVIIAASKDPVLSGSLKHVPPMVAGGKQGHSDAGHSLSSKHVSVSSGLKSVPSNASSSSVRGIKDESSRRFKCEQGGGTRLLNSVKASVASMPPPPPQHGHKKIVGSSGINLQTPMNDEEYAKLLHHELNSSPRMPRISRVSSGGSVIQQPRVMGNGHVQTLTPAKRMPSSQNGNSNGGVHHHDQQVSRKRSKEEKVRDGAGRHPLENSQDNGGGSGPQVKKGVACNGGVRDGRNEVSKRGADEPESFGDGHDGNGISSFRRVGGGAEKGLSENDGEAGKSEVLAAMITPSPIFEDGLVMSGDFDTSGRLSRSGSGERKTSGEGKPVTLPVVIEEEIQASSCSTLSFEAIYSAVTHHLHKLRKANGEWYSHSSHRQAVLDYLRNQPCSAHPADDQALKFANEGLKRRRISSPSNSEDEGESGCCQRHVGPREKRTSCHELEQFANGTTQREELLHNDANEQERVTVAKKHEDMEVRKGKRKARRRRFVQKDGGGGTSSEADKENVSVAGIVERRSKNSGKEDPTQDAESDPPSSSSDEDAVSNYSEEDEEMVGHVKFGVRTRRGRHRRQATICSESSREDDGYCR